jgi:2-polyprenyl-6-hydroxyphenyl methylase/3-demethylubiquinone-9 3-methyltransferase
LRSSPLVLGTGFGVGYVRDRLSEALGTDPTAERPLDSLRLLDIGCGGGMSESMAHLGAQIAGVDVAPESIRVAELHAQRSGLDLKSTGSPRQRRSRPAAR